MLTLSSPAKINRFLHIIGRRPDGYHLLQTLFQFLDVGDTLHFEAREDDQIVLLPDNCCGIPAQMNLIYKAAVLLKPYQSTPQGVTIHLDKQLPLASGLGGGSSNAATTLWGLNYLWDLQLSKATLLELGLRLGADVPVFVNGHTAFGEGVGEVLTEVSLPPCWFVVLIPPCQVSTPKMYSDPELTRDTQAITIGPLAKDEFQGKLGNFKNDFEAVVRKHYPEVDNALKWLSNFGDARLSGSGASVFACFDTQAEAQAVCQQIPSSMKGFVAKGLNRSPLFEHEIFSKALCF